MEKGTCYYYLVYGTFYAFSCEFFHKEPVSSELNLTFIHSLSVHILLDWSICD